MSALDDIRVAIMAHQSNAWAAELQYEPLYSAAVSSRIVVIGQAPGRVAQESGIPWNDASGTRLREWMGLSTPEFYDPASVALLPMDFYYPGKGAAGDLPPRPQFAPLWHPSILAELKQVRLTVLIGSYAQRYYLGARGKRTLTETVAAFREYLPMVIPVVHPSPLNFRWQKNNPWFETEVVPVLRSSTAEALAG